MGSLVRVLSIPEIDIRHYCSDRAERDLRKPGSSVLGSFLRFIKYGYPADAFFMGLVTVLLQALE